MSSSDAPGSERDALAPDDVSERTFPTAFRGFDPVAVRAFLGEVADELRHAAERERELRAAIAALESDQTSAAAEGDAASASLDAAREEADRLLESARADADRAIEEAKAEADRMLRDAKERVAQLGHAATAESARVLEEAKVQAQQAVRAKSDEAEATAVKKLADAEREAASIRVQAREDADAILEAAKERGREMVIEAQSARERLIADISKRKRAATTQLEQLRTGRDRLLESLRVVRRNLDEITMRLEATEGAAAPVAATPEAPATAASAAPAEGAASSEAGNGTRPDVRRVAIGSRVMLGELPGAGMRPQIASAPDPAVADEGAAAAAAPAAAPASTAPASTPSTAPRIDAPQAHVATPDDVVAEATDLLPEPEPEPEPVERRSSALRILRRNRPAASRERAVPPQIGRASAGEGVRIIGRDPADVPPADQTPEPEASSETAAVDVDTADVESVDVEVVEPAAEDVGEEADGDADETIELSDVLDVTTSDQVPDVSPDELPPPLRPEEVRPRIEDLFARLRAEREQASEKAREVLAGGAARGEEASDEPVEAAVEIVVDGADGAPAPDEDADPEATPTSDEGEHLLQARDAVLDPLVGQVTRKLKRSIQDEQNATLDRLRTARAHPGPDDVLAGAETQPAPYRYAALPLLDEAARSAAAAAPFGAVAVGVDDLAQALAEDVCGQIRAKVARVLEDASDEDVDLQTTSERVSSVYREWKTQRIERVATHYLVAAWSRGTFVATPEGTPMRWVVDDDAPCPDCDDNSLAGVTPRGQTFPTGQLHPPAHPGCRCLLAPAHD